jgi:hypothetical protein
MSQTRNLSFADDVPMNEVYKSERYNNIETPKGSHLEEVSPSQHSSKDNTKEIKEIKDMNDLNDIELLPPPKVEEIDQLLIIEQTYQNQINLIHDLVNLKNNILIPNYKAELPGLVRTNSQQMIEEPKLPLNYLILNSKFKNRFKDRVAFESLLDTERRALVSTFEKGNEYNIENYSISKLPILCTEDSRTPEVIQISSQIKSIQSEQVSLEKTLIKDYFDRTAIMSSIRKLEYKVKESAVRSTEIGKKVEDIFSNYY